MSTHNISLSIYKKKIAQNHQKSAAMGVFLGTQERVRNSRGKRAISVRATEVLLYFRLSENISRDLTNNNANIADLSDTNRPTNLVEKFSSLYDDEWTDAFDDLKKVPGYENNTNVIHELLNILLVSRSSVIVVCFALNLGVCQSQKVVHCITYR